jgi:hypothetical protein
VSFGGGVVVRGVFPERGLEYCGAAVAAGVATNIVVTITSSAVESEA